jgi:hypothetical protein
VRVNLAAGHDPLPQFPAGDQRGLQHLDPAGGELGRGQRRERVGVDEHPRGLVVGADVVLRRGQVDAGLAAVGGVDLRDERRRDLHDRHAALVGGGAEAGEVADDAAAERDHVVGARHAGGHELLPNALGARERLVPLAGRNRDRARYLAQPTPVQGCNGLVAHAERARGRAVERPDSGEALLVQQSTTHKYGIVARGGPRPQQRDVGDFLI